MNDSIVPRPPRFLDQVRMAIRVRHYSHRTEKAYVEWVRRFTLFHGKRHPSEMGAPEVTAFLSHLATERGVSASTQNQARAALLFLYQKVLSMQLTWLCTLAATFWGYVAFRIQSFMVKPSGDRRRSAEFHPSTHRALRRFVHGLNGTCPELGTTGGPLHRLLP